MTRRYPENSATAALFSITGDNPWYLGLKFKVHSYYDRESHVDIAEILSLERTGSFKCRTESGVTLYINKSEICLDYIKEHYPEMFL